MSAGRPLAGVRVADFTWVWAGPYGTKLLADMGAEVIKIESGKKLDTLRNMQPFLDGVPDPNASSWFAWYNRNKLSVTLDLKAPEGIELARRIVGVSDIVWDNFTPHVMPSLKLDYDSLCRVRPDIIVVCQSGFGSTGPYAQYPSFAEHSAAFAGLSALTGRNGGPTVGDVSATGDVAAGANAAFATLAALHHRERTGKGQFIEVSQHDTMVGSMAEALLAVSMHAPPLERRGNRDPRYAPQGVYPCRDGGWVAVSVTDETQWARLAKLIGRPDWAGDPQLATAEARRAVHAEIDTAISAWSGQLGHLEAARLLCEAGITASASLTSADLVVDKHLAHRGFFQPVDDPAFGRIKVFGHTWRMLGAPLTIERPAPRLGEHNRYVLCDVLGLSSEELERLETSGVVA